MGGLGVAHHRLARRSSGCSSASRSATGRCCCSASCCIFTGVQFVTLGLLAEVQARTYHESQDKPTYVIREIVEADSSDVTGRQPASASARSAN